MGTTKQIPREEWTDYFDRFTREHLAGEQREAVTIEVMSPDIGDQVEAEIAHLAGLSYDPRSQALEVWVEEQLDHLAYYPTEVWVIEEDGGFLSAVEVVRSDGTKEVLRIQRSGLPVPIEVEPLPSA